MIQFNYQKNIDNKWINSNKLEICSILKVYFLVLLFIYLSQYNSLTSTETYFIYITLISQAITLYSCFINWKPNIVIFNHYLFIIMLFLNLFFSKNLPILFYFLSTLLLIIIIWILKKGRCVFDRLRWEIIINNKSYRIKESLQIILLMVLFYLIKIYYIIQLYE